MEITGKIKQIGETKEFGTNGFQKRELVLTTEEQYPQHILVEFVQDKCALLDTFVVGQRIKVGINLRGREWQSPQGEIKYFNSIQGWRVDSVEATTAAPPTAPPFETMPDAPENETPDDLPF